MSNTEGTSSLINEVTQDVQALLELAQQFARRGDPGDASRRGPAWRPAADNLTALRSRYAALATAQQQAALALLQELTAVVGHEVGAPDQTDGEGGAYD